VEQQDKMADILEEILGDLIHRPEHIDNGVITSYPSPKDLTGKFLIKGKRVAKTDEDLEDSDDDETDMDYVADEFDDILDIDDEISRDSFESRHSRKSVESVTSKRYSQKKVKHGTSQKLSDLTYLATQAYKTKLAVDWFKMHSFSEVKIEKFIKTIGADIIAFNRTNFSRVYPKGTRFASTNYDPSYGWLLGSQMVALNYQTHDDGMRLNQIMFERNGRCGYILKPKRLRDKNATVDYTTSNKTYHVVLTVLSGRHIPKPKESEKGEVIDPYVLIQVKGPPPDNTIEFETNTVWDNGFNPVWNQTFEFDIEHLDLSLIRFAVLDENSVASDIFLCENIVPLEHVRNGLRCVQLRSEEANYVDNCDLIVNIKII
jgi:phosphatidylinositol phospholipase C delta